MGMRAKAAVYVIAAIVIGLFVVANWTLLVASVQLNLLVAEVQAPLIVLLLMLAGAILLLDLAVHAFSSHGWTRERRTLVRDLEAARLRADKEEESRTAALRTSLERELAAVRGQLDRVLAGQSALLGRTPPVVPMVTPLQPVEAVAVPVPPPSAVEPELIPPRRGRDTH